MVDMDMAGKALVPSLINLDNRVEQIIHPFSGPADGRTDRYAEKPTELLHVQGIPARTKFIVHV